MGRSAFSSRRQPLLRAGSRFTSTLALAALFAAACGRTPLLLEDPDASLSGIDGDVASDAPFEALPDAPPDARPDSPVKPPRCEPVPETCNGKDDDCNGHVDDGLASIPCPGGGSRYCVAGRMSECPKRCEVCVPGSQRICMLSYCRYWGVSHCAADGRSFGSCEERDAPPECKAIAQAHKDSVELEQCAIDAGYCVVDQFDLDHDHDSHELVGTCDQVTCAD